MSKILKKFHWIYDNCKSSIPFIFIIVILGSLISSTDVGKALIIKSLIDSATSGDYYNTKRYIVLLAFILISSIIMTLLRTISSNYATEKIKNTLQRTIYNHIIHSTWLSTSEYHSVELLTRLTNDVNTITSMLIENIPNIISLSVMLVLAFLSLLTISPLMSLISLFIFPFLILLSKIYGRKLNYYYIELQKKETIYNRFLQECFNNILILKSFSMEKNKLIKLDTVQKDKLNLSMKKTYFSSISDSLLRFSSLLGYFIAFIWGAFSIFNTGISSFGSFTAMLDLFNNIQLPIYGLSSSMPQIVSAFAATDRLIELDNMPLEHIQLNSHENFTDNSNVKEDTPLSEVATTKLQNNLNICFKNVYFSYSKEKLLLNNISFKINLGETIGLIGPSGEGKTTIIRLILSLIQPSSGNIYIDNHKLSIYDRKLISYVPQGNTLFSGSILDNIKLDNNDIDNDKIYQALKLSCSYDFVNSLPNKLNTILGENGLGISQGQAQRLTIARALVINKPILILDEATSSLDKDTEFKIINSIKNLSPKPLCIIITHRLASLSICDKIFKLENGSLILDN